jgi:hypothetical protein
MRVSGGSVSFLQEKNVNAARINKAVLFIENGLFHETQNGGVKILSVHMFD